MWFGRRCCGSAPGLVRHDDPPSPPPASKDVVPAFESTAPTAPDATPAPAPAKHPEPERDPTRSRGLRGALSSKLQVDYSELEFYEQIGKGSFKTVFRGQWGSTKVAIVRMRKGGVVTDARVMQRLSTHPNLVQFYRWAVDAHNNEHIVMELVAMGSLEKLLQSIGPQLRTRVKVDICAQVCSAMCALVRENVLHRDLAARNVLVQNLEPVTIKVTDFGLARDINRSYSMSGNLSMILQCLPIRWVPPEVITRNEWSEKSDIWAYGVTLWEIFSNGAEPYANLEDEEVVAKIRDGFRLARPERCPPKLYALMLRCWDADPRKRPTFAEIAEMFRAWRREHQAGVRAVREGASSPEAEGHMTSMTTDSDLGDLVLRLPSHNSVAAELAAGARQPVAEVSESRTSTTATTSTTSTGPRSYPSAEQPSPAPVFEDPFGDSAFPQATPAAPRTPPAAPPRPHTYPPISTPR